MILDIRGTHGSGKSWIIHQLIAEGAYFIDDGYGCTVGTYLTQYQSAVVGTYTRKCGGCDGIKTADEICRRIKLLDADDQYRHVLLEGILVAHTYERYAKLANKLGGYLFCFLDTPMEVCVQRVLIRRKERGNTTPFDPNKHVIKDFKCIRRVREKLKNGGHHVIDLDWQDPLSTIRRWLK